MFLIPPDETAAAVTSALEAGYRLLDTAQGYRNEKGVGDAIARSDVPRDEIFTTKLVNGQHRRTGFMTPCVLSTVVSDRDSHLPSVTYSSYVSTWHTPVRITYENTPTEGNSTCAP